METIKMGKRGTIVLPAKLRKQFGLEDGTVLITEARDGEIRLRPALITQPERWTPERTAYFMLINCTSQEEWDRMMPDVIALGIDPSRIAGIEANHRDTLRTDSQWEERERAVIGGRLSA
jgi:AbrB family looped-hinge helix DNA binding protein